MTFCTKKITMQNNQQLAFNAQKPLTEMNSTVASYAVQLLFHQSFMQAMETKDRTFHMFFALKE